MSVQQKVPFVLVAQLDKICKLYPLLLVVHPVTGFSSARLKLSKIPQTGNSPGPGGTLLLEEVVLDVDDDTVLEDDVLELELLLVLELEVDEDDDVLLLLVLDEDVELEEEPKSGLASSVSVPLDVQCRPFPLVSSPRVAPDGVGQKAYRFAESTTAVGLANSAAICALDNTALHAFIA